MAFYLTMFFFTTIFVIFKDKKLRIISWLFVILSLIIICGLRNKTVGSDTIAYYRIFSNISKNTNQEKIAFWFEPLYIFYNRLIASLGGSPEVMILGTALIIYSIIAYVIYKYSPSLFLSLALFYGFFYFNTTMSAVRQSIALSIIIFSIKFIIEKKLIYFLISLLIASGFHFSALVFLPSYFLNKVNLKWFHLVIIWLISFIYIIKSDMMFLTLNLIPQNIIPENNLRTIINPDVMSRGITSLGLRLIFLQIIMILLLFVYAKIKDNKGKVIILVSIFGIFMENVVINSSYFQRIAVYNSVFLTLGIPIAIQYTFKKYERFFVTCLLYIASIIFFIRYLSVDVSLIVPYSTIFNVS